MLEALRPGGVVLDLQVIRPNPRVEVDGRLVTEIDGEPLFRNADAATAAIDERIAAGDLAEEAGDDHDVRQHFPKGEELVEHVAQSLRSLPQTPVPAPVAVPRPCGVLQRFPPPRLA